MAQDEIILKLRVEDGQLTKATAQIDKQSKAIDKNTKKKKEGTKAANRHNKAEKALYQSNLSSAKSFSKMNQTMGGSSGVVAAYATLAANVFALTAAFGALSRAAQVTQLEKGLALMGAQSGRTLSVMAEGLREVTGMAISAEEAMRGAAMGISGGFGGAELKGLAEIAKGASVALGRDLSDAFDRLTRGAIKLEPEILDELGIMVRVDEAAENYAATIGKTANSLTQFEKRQAFMNAILEQGKLKFGDIAEQVDPDPYARLAATFADLTKNVFQFINTNLFAGFFGLGEVVGYLANNMGVLAGVTIMFGSTIAGKMLPFLGQAGSNALKTAASMQELADETRDFAKASVEAATKKIGQTGAGGKIFRGIAESAKDGELSVKELEDAQKSLGYSMRALNKETISADTKATAAHKLKIKNIKTEQANIQQLIVQKKIQEKLDAKAAITAAKAGTTQVAGTAIQAYTQGVTNFGEAWSEVGKATDGLKGELDDIAIAAGKVDKDGKILWNAAAMNSFAVFTEKAKNKMRLLGAAIIKALPWIGALVAASAVLYGWWKLIYNTEELEKYNKHMDDLAKIQESMPDKMKEYRKSLDLSGNLAQNQIKTFKIISGIVSEINSMLKEEIKLMKELVATEQVRKVITGTRVSMSEAAKGEGKRAIAKTLADAAITDAGEDLIWEITGALNATQLQAANAITSLSKTGAWQSFVMLLESEVPETAARAREELIKILDSGALAGTVDEQIALYGQLTGAIFRVTDESMNLGPALDQISKNLQESERSAANFIATLGKKTPVDDLARSVNATNDSILEMMETFTGDDKEALMEKVGKALTEVGPKEMEMIGQRGELDEFVLAYKEVIAAQNELKKLQQSGAVDDIPAAEEALRQQLIVFGSYHTSYSAYTKEVNKVQEEFRTQATQLKAIEKAQKAIAKLAKTSTKAAGLSTKLAIQKANIEKEGKRRLADMNALTTETWQTTIGWAVKELDLVGLIGESEFTRNQVMKENNIEQDQLNDAIQRELTARLAAIAAERQSLELSARTGLEKNQALKTQLDLEEKIANIKRETAEIEQRIQKFIVKGTTELNPAEVAMNKIEAAREEWDFAVKRANLEMAILDYKAKLQEVDIIIANKEIEAYNLLQTDKDKRIKKINKDAVMGDINESTQLAKDAITESVNQLEATFKLAIQEGYKAIRDAIESGELTTGQGLTMTNRLNNMDTSKLAGFDSIEEITPESRSFDQFKKDKQAEKAAEEAEEKRKNIEKLKNAAAGFIGEFAKISPEGEAYSAALGGMLDMADGFSIIADAGEDSSKRIEGIMHTMQGITTVMDSISKARVAALDNEIAAEEARDGKSAKSLAKIKALKKQKYEMEKKAFQQKKKMSIAQALINTYEGVTAALKDKDWPMAAAVLAMGLAQVAMISKTQFTGAAPEASSVSPPSEINIGKRSNKVDVSRAASAGELAYLRGERGIGTTATNFTPRGGAAGLRKGYASGGEILVGERGPEVIRPTAEGYTVVPNDALGGKNIVNASFEIHAIDAAGVEEVLVEQQGNIINMIRSAANDHGQEFLEEVDTTVYGGTPRSPGGIDY